jgi:DNA repair protein RecO
MLHEISDAIIVRTFAYGESSRIVHVFSAAGPVAIMAKGARKQKSPWLGRLEPLYRVNLHVQRKENRELDILTSVDVHDYQRPLLEDYDKQMLALTIIDSARQLFTGNQDLTAEYKYILATLNDVSKNTFSGLLPLLQCLHYFIQHSGFAFHVENCRDCGRSVVESPVHFHISDGNYVCGNCSQTAGLAANMAANRLLALRGIGTEKIDMHLSNRDNWQKILHFYLTYIRSHWNLNFTLPTLEMLQVNKRS